MLKKLIRSEIGSIIGGRGCSCCCKRNPYINGYKGIWMEDVDSESICLSLCNTRKDSLGYMSCIDMSKGEFGCSPLNNTQLADLMDSYRKEYPGIQLKVNVESLRGTTH